MKTGPVVRRDWLDDTIPSIESALRMYHAKRYPDGIEAFMVLTPLKRAMRAIYGKGNLGVAWALFKDALDEFVRRCWLDFRYRIGWLDQDMKDAQQDVNEWTEESDD